MEKEAFVQQIVPLRTVLLARAKGLTRDADRAEDLVQEVMLRLWDKRGQLDGHPNHQALALKILQNCFLDEEKRKKIQQEATLPLPSEERAGMGDWELIQWIVEHLPPLQRRIFRMKDIEGYETEEIEQLTGCSADNIRKNLSRARKKIREDYIRLNERRKPR